MRKRKVISLILALTLCVGLMAVSAAAEGETPNYDWYDADKGTSEDDPYIISSVADLMGLGKLTQGAVEGVTEEAVDFAGKYIKLNSDLDLSGIDWLNIDSEKNVASDYRIKLFAGTFDGDGHTISNLTLICNYEGSSYGIGLFHSIYHGTVKNLTLTDVTATISAQDSFGAIAATIYGNAENCHVSNVDVTGTGGADYSTGAQAAGMFRLVSHDTDASSLTNCTASNVNVNITGTVKNTSGLVGYVRNGSLTNCSAEKVTIQASGDAYWTGGLVGYIYTPETKSEFSGCTVSNVSISAGGETCQVGGFAGYAQNSEFTNCSAQNVSITYATVTKSYEPAGFCGLIYDAKFTDCSASQIVITDKSALQTNYLGGFAGYAQRAEFSNCSVQSVEMKSEGVLYAPVGFCGCICGDANTGAKAENCSVDSVKIYAKAGVHTAGGFVGLVGRSYWNSMSDQYVSFQSSRVTNVSIVSGGGLEYVGGFAGYSNRRSSFSGCAADGVLISNSGADSLLTETGEIGGFIGETQNGDTSVTNTFDNCHVTGLEMTLVGHGTEQGDSPTPGGFIGSVGNGSRFTDCYASGRIDSTGLSDIEVSVGIKKAVTGGFVGDLGWNDNVPIEMTGCTADVDITAKGVAGGFVGSSGIVITGNNQGQLRNRFKVNATFTNCVAAGSVVSLEGAAGGFVGEGYTGTYINCESKSEVYGVYAGGLVGEIIGIEPQANKDINANLKFENSIAAPLVFSENVIGELFAKADETYTTVATFTDCVTPDYFMAKATSDTTLVKAENTGDVTNNVTNNVTNDVTNVTVTGTVSGGYALLTPKDGAAISWKDIKSVVLVMPRTGADLTAEGRQEDVDPGAVVIYVSDNTLRKHILVQPVVTFVFNNGSENEVIHVPYGDPTPVPANPTRAGYTFTGWTPTLAETVTEDATYTAQWSRILTPATPDPEPVEEEPAEEEPAEEPVEEEPVEEPEEEEEVEVEEEEVPLADIPDVEVPLAELPEEEEDIAEEEIPLDGTPNTGDNKLTMLWAALAVVALAGVVIVVVPKKKGN